MKSLILTASLAALSSVNAITWTSGHEQAIEKSTLALAKTLPAQTVIIGRTGLPDTRVAIVVSKEGHLLSFTNLTARALNSQPLSRGPNALSPSSNSRKKTPPFPRSTLPESLIILSLFRLALPSLHLANPPDFTSSTLSSPRPTMPPSSASTVFSTPRVPPSWTFRATSLVSP
jgi:hypothetical protein